MTVYGFSERDDAENLKLLVRTNGGGTKKNKRFQGDYLVKSPSGGIASGATEDCNVHDSDWNDLGWTVPVKNPWTGSIGSEVKLLVGPEASQGILVPRAIDCGS